MRQHTEAMMGSITSFC